MLISSTDNALFKRLRRLAESPRACRTSQRTLIEGAHLIEAAVAARARLHTLVTRGERLAPGARALVDTVQTASDLRPVAFSPALYDAIAPVEHGVGVLAELAFSTDELPRGVAEDAVWLDGVQDPGNVGTLMRVAAAAGVRHFAAGDGTAALWSPKVMRAAMGAHFTLRTYQDVDVDAVRAGFVATPIAADSGAGDDLFRAEWGRGATIWIFGNEGAGLSEAASAAVERRIRIPIAAGIESMNVATAAAVCLFEQVRRRRAFQRT